MKRIFSIKKKGNLIAVMTVFLLAVVLVCSDFASNETAKSQTDEGTTMSGMVECLQLKVPGEDDGDCKYAMKTPGGEYYLLDLARATEGYTQPSVGDHFFGSGVVTPVEALSSDVWQRYNMKGIFSVTGTFVLRMQELR